jgi:hypothetical protein
MSGLRVTKLLRGRRSGGMFHHGDMDDASTIMGEEH